MANWQDPRPLFPWSQPPPGAGPLTAPKLRPNIYARMARFSLQNAVGVLLAVLFLLATAITVSLLNITVDLDKPSPAQRSTAPGSSFAADFPGADDIIRIDLSADAPGSARAAAVSLAEALKTQTALVKSAALSGLQGLDPRFRPYYLPTEELRQRVDVMLALSPYYQLVAAAPNLTGLNNLVVTAKSNADAGRAPAALAPLLQALARAVQGLAEDKANAVYWPQITGIDEVPNGRSETVFVIPQEGEAKAVAQSSRDLIAKLQNQQPFMSVATNIPADTEVRQSAMSSMRQIIVALFMATLFLLSALSFGLREPRIVFFVIVPPAIACLFSLALTPFLVGSLDRVSAALPILIVPGTLALSVPYVLALERHEKKAISTQSIIMLAAQQCGAYIASAAAMAAMTWATWWVLGGSMERGFALTMVLAHLIGAAATLLVLPTLAGLIPRERSEIVPAAHLAPASRSHVITVVDEVRPWLTAVLTALSAVALLVLLATPLSKQVVTKPAEPISLYAENRDSAAKLVAALQADKKTVGAVTWADSFLPGELDAKRIELQRLAVMALPQPGGQPTPPQQVGATLKKLDEGLKALANHPGLDATVKASAQELRRSVALVLGASKDPVADTAKIESVMFSGLPIFVQYVKGAASLQPPVEDDIPEGLRTLFVSKKGSHRITVAPASQDMTAQDFYEALNRITGTPVAAETPIVSTYSAPVSLFLVVIAIIAVGNAFVALSLINKPSRLVAFPLSLVMVALLDAGLAWLMGFGLSPPVMASLLTGLVLASAAGLWLLSDEALQWATPYGYLHAFSGGAAVLLPAIMLSLWEFRELSDSLLLFLILAAGASTIAAPQLAQWLERLLRPANQKAKPATQTKHEPAKAEPPALVIVEKQVSTTPPPDDNSKA